MVQDAPSPRRSFVIRPCFQQDLQLVQLIYAHHVITGTGTFEIEPPSMEEMEARWSRIVARGLPYLVAADSEDFTRVLGFAYAQPFRDRAAYAQTFEDSIYVAPTALKRGIGRVLLRSLLDEAAQSGARQMIAVIGDSANQASIHLHERAGFRRVGLLQSAGLKFGRWLDVVLMQRALTA